jgi:copper transport protein
VTTGLVRGRKGGAAAGRFARVAAGFALVAGLVLLTPDPGYAHAYLIGTSPANGAQLDSAPEEVRLRFSERVTVAAGGVELREATGRAVPTDPAVVPAEAPTEVRLPVPAELGDGTWIVSYRVTSADSHPVSGALVFSVGAAQADLATTLDAESADPVVPVVFSGFRWASYAGLALLAGGLIGFVLWWPGGWANRRARRLVAAGWVTSLVGAAGSLLLQGPYAAGRSLAGVADPVLLSATIDTDYGRFMLARLGLLAAAAALVAADRQRSPRWRAGAALTLGAALPATWVGTGHANTAGGPVDALVATAHLVAMSGWFGGLALLALCLLPRSAAPPADEIAAALPRFSRLATAAVAILVGTGVYVAWREVGSLGALAGTSYGRLLAFKLAAIGVLLGFGAISRSVVQRRYLDRAGAPAGRGGATPASRSRRRAARSARAEELGDRAQLRQSVRLEVGTAVAVLVVVSVLVATPPGAVVTAAEALEALPAAGPVREQLPLAAEGTVDVRVDPAWTGENRLDVTVRDVAGGPWDVPEVTASFALPERELGPLPVELTRTGPGEYQASRAQLPVSGTWQLRLAVRTSEIDSTILLVDVPIT